jgi:hypothetical protein
MEVEHDLCCEWQRVAGLDGDGGRELRMHEMAGEGEREGEDDKPEEEREPA